MNVRLAVPVALFAVSACANPVARKLEGRWTGDTITNLDAAQLPSAIGWVRGTSFEFAGGNVTVAIPTELPRSGEYEVTSATDTEALLAVRRPDGAIDSLALKFDGDQHLRWQVGGGREIILRRID